MKKKTNFSGVLVMLLALVSNCDISKDSSKEILKAEFIEEVRNDRDFKKLCEIERGYREKMSIDYYSFATRSEEYINKNLSKIDQSTT